MEELGLHVYNTRQIKAAWGGSCVLRVKTNNAEGNFYFKAVSDKPPVESAVVQSLAEMDSGKWAGVLPQIVSTNEEHRWMLMRDFGDQFLDEENEADSIVAIKRFAQLQQQTAHYRAEWERVGCPDFAPERLAERLQALSEDTRLEPHFRVSDSDATLASEEQAAIASLLPKLNDVAAHLRQYNIPMTLVQMNFRPGNVAWQNDAPLFFDWGESARSHPFFSMMRFVAGPPVPTALCSILVNAYLEEWMNYEPMDRLESAYAVVKNLYSAFLAVRIHAEVQFYEDETS